MTMLSGQFINQSSSKKWYAYRRYCHLIHKQITQHLGLTQSFEYALILVDSQQIQTINHQFRQIDKSTDVISFANLDSNNPMVLDIIELGDVFINVDAIESQAKLYGHSKKREFCFLLTHGLLHLFQYDHQTLDDERKMIKLQEDILYDIAQR
jgi:probable rRNA maturation factor